MYRRSLEKNMAAGENNPDSGAMDVHFLSRVIQLPLVTASLTQLSTIYSQAKESNRLLKYTLNKAESGVAGVASTAAPLVNKFERPITILDGFACGQLDKLQERYPIINKSADVWVSKSQDVYGSSLKPSVDKLLVVKDVGVGTCAKVYDVTVKPSLQTYSRAVNYASEKTSAMYHTIYSVTVGPAVNLGVYTFTTAKDYSIGTVQAASQYSQNTMTGVMNYGMGKAGEAMATQYGKILQSQMDGVVDKADQYLDYYLPEAEPEAETEKKIEIDSMEPETTITKACLVTTKARRRMYQKAMTDMQNLKMRTQESIDSLKHTIDLIQYDKVTKTVADATTVAIDGAKFTSDKLKYYWEEMNKTGEEVENKDGDSTQVDRMSVERRLIATARHLTQKIKLGVATVSSTASSLLPGSVSDSVLNARKYTQDLYNSFASANTFNDLSQTVLDQAREKLDYLTTALSFATEYVVDNVNIDWLKKWKAGKVEQNQEVREQDSVQASEPPAVVNGWEMNNLNQSSQEVQTTEDQEQHETPEGKEGVDS